MVGGKRIVILLSTVSVIAFLIFGGTCYVNNYYHATETAEEALKGTSEVKVTETKGYYLLEPVEAVDTVGPGETGIIFYPGAKVEETAYVPLLSEFAKCGYPVYLMRMPARLAVLDPDAADTVIYADSKNAESVEDTEDNANGVSVTNWILMGHSLGGAMAADYAAGHEDTVSALVLLAAYSTKDLTEKDIRVLSIYGSEDSVLNQEKYQRYWDNLPEDTVECVIDGGNHAGFGYYGDQKGDKQAQISRDEQQQAVVDAVTYYLQQGAK